MEPRSLRSQMGESAPGQGQVGTQPGPLLLCLWLLFSLSPHLTQLSHILSYKDPYPDPHSSPGFPCPTGSPYPSPSLTHPPLPGSLPRRNPSLVWPLPSHVTCPAGLPSLNPQPSTPVLQKPPALEFLFIPPLLRAPFYRNTQP